MAHSKSRNSVALSGWELRHKFNIACFQNSKRKRQHRSIGLEHSAVRGDAHPRPLGASILYAASHLVNSDVKLLSQPMDQLAVATQKNTVAKSIDFVAVIPPEER